MEKFFSSINKKTACSIYGIIYGGFFIAQIKGEQ
jgi:hypothetical protein